MSTAPDVPRPGAYVVEISAEQAGQRLDNFLLARLKGAPRSLVYRIVRGGEVRVNAARVRPDRRLEEGDKVRVPPVRLAEREPGKPQPGMLAQLADRFIYEDAGLLVVDKPSGIAVHGGSGVSAGLIEALRSMRPDCRSLELVHRLDRDTSGCILVAKKRSVLRHLHAALRDGGITKTYVALVEGQWPKARTLVRMALEKNVVSSGERVVRAGDGGKASETRFRVLESFAGSTLVEAVPVTGRTHQIRVHTQVSGHPIAGDEKYGNRDFNRNMRELGLRRLFLHAASLEFEMPDGARLRVEAPVDPELQQFLTRLRG